MKIEGEVAQLPYDAKLTGAEYRAVELLTELRSIVWDLPEQHVMEKRELQDKVSSLADAIYARIGFRLSRPDAVGEFRADPDSGYADARRRGIRSP